MKRKIVYAHNGKKYRIKSKYTWLKLWLTGEIDICGISLHPRPVEKISKFANAKPGLVSLHGLSKLNQVKQEKSQDLDLFYINNQSLLFEIKIFLGFLFNYFFYKNRYVASKFINILGVNILNTNYVTIKKLIQKTIQENKKIEINFLNANNLNVAYRDSDYRKILNNTNNQYLLADGSGVKIAAKLTGQKLQENLNGTDLFPKLCRYANSKNHKFFLFGASEKVVKQLRFNIKQKYPNIEIVGCEQGFGYDNDEIIKKVNLAKPDFLFVAMGTPIQEKWIFANSSKLDARVILGVGGLFDFYAGVKKRAPMGLRKLGLEWTYRLYIEPKRMWKRYILGNPLFLFRCLFF